MHRCQPRVQRSCVVVEDESENIAAAVDADVGVGQLDIRAWRCREVSARWELEEGRSRSSSKGEGIRRRQSQKGDSYCYCHDCGYGHVEISVVDVPEDRTETLGICFS